MATSWWSIRPEGLEYFVGLSSSLLEDDEELLLEHTDSDLTRLLLFTGSADDSESE